MRGWWRPENTGTATPSISLGYDTSETDATGNSNTTAYFVGLNWQDMVSADDRIGIAGGSTLAIDTHVLGASDLEEMDPFLWEASYSFKVNDSMTIIPAIFGGQDIVSYTDEDYAGAALTTKFKF